MDPGSQPLARGLGDCQGGRLMRYLRHPFHGTVVAYFALFVAVSGGTAFAFIGVNQVTSSSIKNGAVNTVDLHDGAITALKLHRHAVTQPAIARGAVGNENLGKGV